MRLILGIVPEPWVDWIIRMTQRGWARQREAARKAAALSKAEPTR